MSVNQQPIKKLAFKLAVCIGLTLTAVSTVALHPCQAQTPPDTHGGKGGSGKEGANKEGANKEGKGILDRRVSVNVEDATLSSVLKTLMKSVGADYTLAPELRRVTVTAHLTNLPLGIALDTLLKAGSLPATYHVENGVTFFTLRAETPALLDNSQVATGQPEVGRGLIRTVHVNYIDAAELARLLGGAAITLNGQSFGVVNPNAPGGLFGPRGGGGATGQTGGNLLGSLFDGSLVLIGNAGAGFR